MNLNMYEIKDCAKVLRINLMNKRITNQVFISRILSILMNFSS